MLKWPIRPPRAGPNTKPTPKAAPRYPSPIARRFGGVMSAAYACATESEADEKMPARMRAANCPVREWTDRPNSV